MQPPLDRTDVVRWLTPLLRQRTLLLPAARAQKPERKFRTQFGGRPTALRGERWPRCGRCHGALRFVCQVDYRHDALHEPRLEVAFITFFYCWECHPWGKEQGPARSWCVRAYPHAAEQEAIVLRSRAAPFTQHFVRARLGLSLPDAVGFERHCPELWAAVPGTSGSREAWANWDVVERAAGELQRAEDLSHPHTRNRGLALGGYPHWVNGPDETPDCGTCGQGMELLVQLSPSPMVDAEWGDVGTLYLFMCRVHINEVSLRIQCT
ncbi:DUF1963 domain-containing protein [Archangium lansingense]|uniref:DUF1963 domain-containing protein n=1 Tax=Archangium lansingense TaxID=2995310 RepID=A0ABT4A817_9BACT|nr:DUF1963 domain-containing protein [Archangium lansinium]MCY1077805.1 DUF1963 domain-containing protein [Archangium lansinium]